MFDAVERIGPPARTLIITNRLCSALGLDPSQAVVNRTGYLRLISSRRSATISLREPDLIVEREALVLLLAERAAAAGVEIRLGRRFAGIEAGDRGVTIRLETQDGRTERVCAWNVIGADGASSQVARAAGLGGFPKLSLLQARVELPSWVSVDTTQVWLHPQATRFFYWLEPESPSYCTVGLIADNPRQARESLANYLAAYGLAPLSYQSDQIPRYQQRVPVGRRVSGARILLVGDAAGQVKVTTVGGVVTGLRGAQAAARAILRGSSYGRELRSLRRELGLHLLVHRVVSRCTAADYDDMLGLLNARAQGALGAYTRDEISRVLFPSLLAQPRLLLLAGRCLLRASRRASSTPDPEHDAPGLGVPIAPGMR